MFNQSPMRMVIAVDNSTASRKAMSHGLAVAGMLKKPPEVKIVYAIGLNPEQTKPIQFLDSLDRRNNMDIQEDSKVEVEKIKRWLNGFSKKHGDYEFVTLQRHAPVGQIITQFLYDMPADMLVMGSSSRSSVSGMIKSLLGSTCEYCLRHSPCPVTIVKQSDTKDAA